MKRLLLIIAALSVITFSGFCEIFKANAEASYYAEKFHGRKTANGEIFNMNDYTAAHKTLPFNTILKVTNLSNGKSVNVRINDRGPFVAGREIDLSKAAAIKLDMIKSGTARVSIEILQKGNGGNAASTNAGVAARTAPSVKKPVAEAVTEEPVVYVKKENRFVEEVAVKIEPVKDENRRWDIQLASFGKMENAQEFAQKLLQAGFKNVVYQKSPEVTRVVIRDVSSADLDGLLAQLDSKGFKDHLVKVRQ